MRRLTSFLISDRTVMAVIMLNTAALFLHEMSARGTAVRLFFVAAVFIGGILGLSLANAVFVDEMMMDNTDALERKVDALTDEVRALRDELRKNLEW